MGFPGSLSDGDLDRQIAALEQVAYGDDRAALEAFQREALPEVGVRMIRLTRISPRLMHPRYRGKDLAGGSGLARTKVICRSLTRRLKSLESRLRPAIEHKKPSSGM